ncbi:hypothetical protein CCMA1212_004889 [Trichoderma ghanense]|uniref:Uncharacterized protein n=1 Tax=Trichoderma ghanense TaxID=65468 RepID=A0ABY2H4F8_9HYPO
METQDPDAESSTAEGKRLLDWLLDMAPTLPLGFEWPFVIKRRLSVPKLDSSHLVDGMNANNGRPPGSSKAGIMVLQRRSEYFRQDSATSSKYRRSRSTAPYRRMTRWMQSLTLDCLQKRASSFFAVEWNFVDGQEEYPSGICGITLSCLRGMTTMLIPHNVESSFYQFSTNPSSISFSLSLLGKWLVKTPVNGSGHRANLCKEMSGDSVVIQPNIDMVQAMKGETW